MSSFIDYTINGLVIGNIYALLAVGLALIFGVANLINFAHGSVYTLGAYIGWAAITYLHTPLPATMAIVFVACAGVGVLIERIGLRPLQGRARIAPLLATIGVSFVLDQIVQLVFSPNPRAVPNDLPDWRLNIGGGSIGALDLLIAAIGLVSAGLLFAFLRFTRLGFAVRATAQDREAAQQMGVDVDTVNSAVFAIASALGGLSGLLVGMYYNHIDPGMSFQATLKGIVAVVIGGVGNVPGAIVGSLMLGLIESYGIALFGTTYRNLFAFVLLIGFLLWLPNGLFGGRAVLSTEPLTGSFIAPSRPVRVPPWAVWALAVAAFALPLATGAPYLLQTLTNAWLAAMLALSLTLISGTTGQISFGQAGLLAIGGYASALLVIDLGAPTVRFDSRRGPDRERARHAAGFSRVPTSRPLHRHRDARDRGDRQSDDSQLGEPDGRRDGDIRHSPDFAAGPGNLFGPRGLLALPRRGRRLGAVADAAAQFASGAHVAGGSRGRDRGAILRDSHRPV